MEKVDVPAIIPSVPSRSVCSVIVFDYAVELVKEYAIVPPSRSSPYASSNSDGGAVRIISKPIKNNLVSIFVSAKRRDLKSLKFHHFLELGGKHGKKSNRQNLKLKSKGN